MIRSLDEPRYGQVERREGPCLSLAIRLLSSICAHTLILTHCRCFSIECNSEIAQECPLIDEAWYLITAKIKIEHPDHPAGSDMQCEIDGNDYDDCPRLLRRIYHDDGSYDATEDRWVRRGVVGKWGEWFHFTSTWQFRSDQNELGTNVIGQTFTLERFPVGSTVSLDDFVFELPSPKSFLPQDGRADTCAEVIVNGDAEDNDGGGFHPWPMYSSNPYRFEPLILEEDDGEGGVNRFYRTKARDYRGHSMRWRPNAACLVRGFVFEVSHRMRISNFSRGPMTYYLRFRGQRPDGSWAYPTILECPAIGVDDGWKSCSGPLIISEEMGSLTDISVEIHFPSNKEYDGEFADVDWDDISIAFVSGVSGTTGPSAGSRRFARNLFRRLDARRQQLVPPSRCSSPFALRPPSRAARRGD